MSEKTFEVMRGVVHPWHHDHFGHMNVRHYAPFFDDAVYHFWSAIGIGYGDMQDNFGVHTVTAQATTIFRRELGAGDLFVIHGHISRIGGKSVTFHFTLNHLETGETHAEYEIIEVFFDPNTRGSTEMPDSVRAILQDAQGASA